MANEKTYPNYLMHYRTKGSKNGISTTKGYTAVGHRANGHWVNGHYVYYEDEAKQRAFRQGLAEARARNSAYENQAMVKRMENARKADVQDQKIYGKKIKGYTRLADISPYERQRLANKYLENTPQHQTAANQHNANVSGMNAAYDYAQRQKARKPSNIGAYQAGDAARAMSELAKNKSGSKYTSSHQNVVSQAAAERAGREAALGRQKKASKGTSFSTSRDAIGNVRVTHKLKAGNTSNNWQQTANKTAGILGNMSREDRSLMKSKEWVSHDKNGKKQVNNSFNVNNKYGYSNYTKNDKGWHDVHMGEYNTAGVKGVKKQQDWNTSFERNHRSDIGNAIADAKEDAKKAFKEAKADAKQTYVNLKSKLKSKFKKKKK